MDQIVKPEKLTAVDVRACIQRHYGSGGEQYAVLFEVRNGTAWVANRSVDAVVMGLWPSLGMHLSGMEIKVDRYDWLRELRDPKKASDVFEYFDKWWLVAPADVAKMEEIPEPWGWLVPENGTLRKARDAALNPNVKPVDRHFLGALLRRVAKTDDVFVQKAVQDALREQHRTHEAEIEKLAMSRMGNLKEEAAQWAKVRELLKGKPDDYLFAHEVIEAIALVVKSGVAKSWSGLRSLAQAVDRAKEDLAAVADELGLPKEPITKRRRSR
jgi:hypothetical protein